MSLRPSIYAADLARFRAAIAGGGLPRELIAEWYSERVVKDVPADIYWEIDRLLAGSWEGKVEANQQVCLVGALAHACNLDADDAIIHWGNWKIGAYERYFEMLQPLLTPQGLALCDFIRAGRAMFGTRIETDWSYYSYLYADEVIKLHEALEMAHALSPAMNSEECIYGFPTEFRGWLKQILARDADLWLFAE